AASAGRGFTGPFRPSRDRQGAVQANPLPNGRGSDGGANPLPKRSRLYCADRRRQRGEDLPGRSVRAATVRERYRPTHSLTVAARTGEPTHSLTVAARTGEAEAAVKRKTGPPVNGGPASCERAGEGRRRRQDADGSLVAGGAAAGGWPASGSSSWR